MTINPTALKWQCGRCSHWNKIENGKCAQCGALSQQFATAFRLHNVLTAEESNFYKGTAPQILREIRAIRVLLDDILRTKEERQVDEERAKELIEQIWDLDAKITKMMNENRGARLSKEKPVHDYDLIAEVKRQKEKLIEERRELIIGQPTTQQENKAKGFTVTDDSGGQEVQGVRSGVDGGDTKQEVLAKGEVPQQAPPKDGEPLTESEQIIEAIRTGNVAEIMQKQAAAPENLKVTRVTSPDPNVAIQEAVDGTANITPFVRPATKRTNKASARQELAEGFIKLLELIEKYYKQ